MVLYCLIATLFIMSAFTLFLFDKDFMNLAFITCVMFGASSVWCLIGMQYWQAQLHWATYVVVVAGLSIYIFSVWIVLAGKKATPVRTAAPSASLPEIKPEKIQCSTIVILLYLVLCAIVVLEYYRNVTNIGRALGGTNFTDIMFNYAQANFNMVNSYIDRFIFLVFDFLILSGYIFAYILINNYLADSKIDYRILLLIIFLISSSLIRAGRTELIRYPVYSCVLLYLLWRKKVGWKRKVSRRVILAIFTICGFLLFIFYAAHTIVGRRATTGGIYYISLYFGGPLLGLDLFLQDAIPISADFGRTTFTFIYASIGKRLNILDFSFFSNEFRFSNNYLVGNCYTMFRSFIQDFGYSGTIIATMLAAAIPAFIYKLCRKITEIDRTSAHNTFLLIYFAYTSYVIVMQFYGNNYITNVLNLTEARRFLMLYISYYLLTKIVVKRVYANVGVSAKSRYIKRYGAS